MLLPYKLMQDYNAKLSDFGLARDGPTGDNTHVSTRVVGTHGYAAPEYVATGVHQLSFNYSLYLFPWKQLHVTLTCDHDNEQRENFDMLICCLLLMRKNI